MKRVKCPKCSKIRSIYHVKSCFQCKHCKRWLTDVEAHEGNCRIKDRKLVNPTPCPECKVVYNFTGLSRHRRIMHGIKVCNLIVWGYYVMFFTEHDGV